MKDQSEPVTQDRGEHHPVRTVLAWILFAIALAGMAAAAAFDSPPYASALDITWAASFLAFPIVGLVLALRLPTNPVGWLFEIGPAMVLWGVALDEAGRMEWGESVFAVGLVAILAAVLLFPDGRYPNRWWRYAHLATLAGLLIEPRISPATDGGLAFGANLILAVTALVFRAVTGTPTLRRQILLPTFVGSATS
jgi:hypothetical protein